MKNQKSINRDVARLCEVTYYLTKKWYQIMNETGFHLASISSKKWHVMDKNFDTVKKGTFKQCMDFIISQWKNY